MGTANLLEECTHCTWEGTDAFSGGGCHSCLRYTLPWHFLCLLSTFFSWFHFQSYLCTLADGCLSGYILFPGGVQSQGLSENTPVFGITPDIVWVTSSLKVLLAKLHKSFSYWKLPPKLHFTHRNSIPSQLFSTELHYSNPKFWILN